MLMYDLSCFFFFSFLNTHSPLLASLVLPFNHVFPQLCSCPVNRFIQVFYYGKASVKPIAHAHIFRIVLLAHCPTHFPTLF